MANPINPFADFDEDFQKADVSNIPTPGRVPEGTYKFVCTSKEIKKNGETVVSDHEIFVANSGSKGFKIFPEILEPETVPNPKTGQPHNTKGAVVERVFWGTTDNLIYMKRDLATIMGRPFREGEKLSEVLVNTQWAGRTFEGVVRDEEYPPNSGRIKSVIAFINPWAPPADEGANQHGAAASSADAKKKAEDEAKKKAEEQKKGAAGKGTTGATKGAKSSSVESW